MLFHYLAELKDYQSHAIEACDRVSLDVLDLLIHAVESVDQSTTDRLLPLLVEGKVTYDLLWALFKANSNYFDLS